MSNFKKSDLNKAKEFYQTKKFENAYEIYANLYNEHADKFNDWDKRFYAWSIYRVYGKDITYESSEKIMLVTQLVPQQDCSKKDQACAYTLCVQNYIYFLEENGEYEEALEWLDLLNPEFLNDTNSQYTSKLEKYYSHKSKALLRTEEYDETIEISEEALNTLNNPKDDGIWFKWRIAQAYAGLDENDESLEILLDIEKTKKDWFVYKEIAQIMHLYYL